MDFEFFEKLASAEANASLERFLALGSANVGDLLAQCAQAGIVCNWTIESVPVFLRWVSTKLTIVRTAPDPEVPEWIRKTDTYVKNLFEFDEPSRILILRAAYYLGETFVRNCEGLHWTVGNTETAVGKMPVVSGFHRGFEMAPILIAENLFGRVATDPAKLGDIDTAIATWKNRLGGRPFRVRPAVRNC